MKVEFVKAHTGKDGRNYTVGQAVDLSDQKEAQELIKQGIVREQRQGNEQTQSHSDK
jgi:hypothetical protein